MSQIFFQIIRPVHVHLKTDKVDFKKRPPWKKKILHFFSINSLSRHENRCQMLQKLFWLFQCSKNPLWLTLITKKIDVDVCYGKTFCLGAWLTKHFHSVGSILGINFSDRIKIFLIISKLDFRFQKNSNGYLTLSELGGGGLN